MPIVTEDELQQKEAALAAKIKDLLPDFVRACRANDDAVIIHQDSFAADYQDDEYALLGMAIKFAGISPHELSRLEHCMQRRSDVYYRVCRGVNNGNPG
jgi:hypothetical protein